MKQMDRVAEMTEAHLRNTMQIMVFQLNNKEFYGINIAKVKSIEDVKKFPLIKNQINNSTGNSIHEGYIHYHDRVVPFLNIEKWLGIYSTDSKFMAIMVAEYNKRTICFPVLHLEGIHDIPVEELQKGQIRSNATTYSTLIKIAGQQTTCFILDVENLLVEALGEDPILQKAKPYEFHLKTRLLLAEDSRSAQSILKSILSKTDIEFQIFSDGQEILDYLKGLDDSGLKNVGMIITDLEMPRVDGYQVINFLKSSQRFSHIPVIVNSSMSNEGVKSKAGQLGAVGFVEKNDPEYLVNLIANNMLKG